MMSPTANMPGMLVRQWSSTVMYPRSIAIPTSWYPTPSVTGPRPTETRRISAVNSRPSSRVTVTPFASTRCDLKRTPSSNLIPRLRYARSRSLLEDSSSRATRCERPSMIVTSAPNDFQTEANSHPITPPPRTMTLFGT